MFDIYTDIAFATLANNAGLTTLAGLSATSIVLVTIPKMYAMGVALMLMFGCNAMSREEDSRRKYAHRVLIFNESRLQALNLEYTRYEREKTDLLMATFKFALEDLPQFLIQLYSMFFAFQIQ